MSVNEMEGQQVPIANATKVHLRAFAKELGCNVTNFDTDEKLRQKISEAGWSESYVVMPEIKPTGEAPKGKTAGAAPHAITEPMVELTIHEQPGPGGKRAVFVAVNGTGMLIPRNKRVSVKLRYLRALEDAIQTLYEYDDDAKTHVGRDTPSYSHQVHVMPSDDKIDAWHAFEREQEKKRLLIDRKREAKVIVEDEAA
jgi:hypothetical protein